MKNIFITILFLFAISLLGCQKSNEEKAKEAIRTYLNENLDDMSTYEPVKYGKLDTLYIFDGNIIHIYNINHPLQFVHSKSAERNNQLGFFNDVTGLVEPYDSLQHKLFLLKGQIILHSNVDNHFYSVVFNPKENIQKNKDSDLPVIKSQNRPITFSKLAPNQYEMFHSYRLKDEKGAKYLIKNYFKLSNHFDVIDSKSYSFKFNPYVGVESIPIDSAAADTAAADTAAARY